MPRQYTGKHSFTTVERKQKNGSIYVYQKESWYDPTVKYTRYKLTLLGYKDSDTGQIHETRPRKAEREVSSPVSVELDDNAMIAIIEHISEISGVTAEVLEQGCCKNEGENEDINSIPLVPQPFHNLQSIRNGVSQPPSCPGFCCKNDGPEVSEYPDFPLHHRSVSTDSLSKDSVASSNLSLISTIPLSQIYCFH